MHCLSEDTKPKAELFLVSRSDPRYLKYRNRHYVENNGCHGQQLHYLVYLNNQQIGIISGASSVYGVRARDEYFGLQTDATIKKTQLCSIINNVVYRIEDAPKNAATQILALWRRQIAHDWNYLYKVEVAGFETFVIESDIDNGKRRSGALYRADNWDLIGLTAGNTKTHRKADGCGGLNAKHKRQQVCKKLIYARKVKGIKLATSYKASWDDPLAVKQLSLRRQDLKLQHVGQLPLLIA